MRMLVTRGWLLCVCVWFSCSFLFAYGEMGWVDVSLVWVCFCLGDMLSHCGIGWRDGVGWDAMGWMGMGQTARTKKMGKSGTSTALGMDGSGSRAAASCGCHRIRYSPLFCFVLCGCRGFLFAFTNGI